MLNRITFRQWFYCLTALVLVMQSLAVWHDTTHPFHTLTAQCQAFESINHTTPLDLIVAITPIFIRKPINIESILSLTLISTLFYKQHAIRAPPLFS